MLGKTGEGKSSRAWWSGNQCASKESRDASPRDGSAATNLVILGG